MQQWQSENTAMTFDELSMEQSKGFVKALQELKNLRPQLYSAAEYCEKSYLHNEQKQMVLDNLKDYAVRALVNAVDHLGTVAYKLTDLFEQNTLDVSSAELKVSCLNQRILTCQNYGDQFGLRQQQILVTTPRHHKHYVLQTQAKHVGAPASKSLSWLLTAETNSPTNGASKFAVKESLEIPKPLSAFKSFDNPRREIIRAPIRSKSVLSALFAKAKASKSKRTRVR